MRQFFLPDLGEGLQEAEIVSWHVSEGDRVVSDQPLVSVETSKAVVEIPSPWSGHIAKLYGAPGDILHTGEPLVDFEDASGKDAGAIVGELPAERARQDEKLSETPRTKPIQAAPAARSLARKHGLDLVSITGTGPDGAITVTDVERAIGTGIKKISLRGVRRAMWKNMARSGAEVVPANIMDEALVDHWSPSTDTTMRLVRAIIAGVESEPILNAHFDADRGELMVLDKIDLGIAMDTADGLFVPVLRDVSNRSEADLRSGLQLMKKDVSERKVSPEELRGQTLTLSNFGMIAGQHVTMVVIPPQVAILGAGKISERPIARNGEIVSCKTLPLSLTFDHRVVAGGEAARFLSAIITSLENQNSSIG